MRKIVFTFLMVGIPALTFAVGDQAARDWLVSNTNVSTIAVTALPATALVGRYKVFIENLSPSVDLYISTSTALTVANGFLVQRSSGTLELPIPQGLTIYGLGSAGSAGPVDVRVIEYK